jgi:hypothetical protein
MKVREGARKGCIRILGRWPVPFGERGSYFPGKFIAPGKALWADGIPTKQPVKRLFSFLETSSPWDNFLQESGD